MFKYITLACLIGVATAAPSYGGYGGYAAVEHDAYPRYGFNYAVSDPHTGDHKAQSEHREGGVVKGSYSVAEPDGTLRVVDYSADPHTGFNAVVKRVGAAHHPQMVKAPIVAPVGHAYSTSVVGLGGWGGFGHGGLAHGGLAHGGLAHGGLAHSGLAHGGLAHGGLAHGGLGLAHGGWGDLGHGSWDLGHGAWGGLGLGAYNGLGLDHGHGHY